MNRIPPEIALELCAEVRSSNRGKLYTFNGLWCWVCALQAKGDPRRMCFSSKPDNIGCSQVNRRFQRKFKRFLPPAEATHSVGEG